MQAPTQFPSNLSLKVDRVPKELGISKSIDQVPSNLSQKNVGGVPKEFGIFARASTNSGRRASTYDKSLQGWRDPFICRPTKKKTSAVFSKAPSVSMQQYSRILRETACCARSIHSPVHFSRYTHLRQQPGLLHLGVGDAVILIYSRHLLRTFKVEQGGVFAASRRHPSPAQITISAIK